MEIRSFRYSARARTRRRRAHKRFFSILSTLILLFSISGYSFAALRKPLPQLTISLNTPANVPAETVALSWPSFGQAAIGSIEAGVLAQSSASMEPRPIASTAKLITALAIMKQKPFLAGSQGATITLDATDVGFYNSYLAKSGSVTAVSAGEQITQYQALQALLLPSANNMADSLARWAFGSVEAYVAYANAMVKDTGLTHTIVADASGFLPATISTPADLLNIAREFYANPVLLQIVGQKQAVVPVAGIISNTNQLLLADKAIGLKTGHTNEAGWCLVFARRITAPEDQKTTVLGVVLATPSSAILYSSSENLLSSATSGFSSREVVKKDQLIGTYTSKWGPAGQIVADESLSAYGWKGTELIPRVQTTEFGNGVTKDQNVGSISVGKTNVTLNAQSEIKPPGIWWRLTHYF